MKLYFAPGACSLSPHIVAIEAGIPITLDKVDLAKKKTANGDDFLKVTAKGYVPALELDDGRVLTEGPAIVQYLADLKPEKNLAEKAGTFERAKVQEWLNYIATELHKSFGSLFHPASEDEKKAAKAKLIDRLVYAEKHLENSEFVVGNHFTVADAYLFTVLTWCKFVGIDLLDMPALAAYMDKINNRDSVKKAIADERTA
ncbi:glutathione transferase GstA [uncultured Bartonella sp.]|uniref:glutathione transferase GstA n=1 Tax=uncultured Bartonella sp. TaxID=104108 RepID=UPI0026209EE7|nr:glutathione transferase GstA [uncultured Bartonella sp.]